MILVTGGAYNGKTEFARSLLSESAGDPAARIKVAEGGSCPEEDIYKASVLENFHLYVQRFPEKMEDPEEFCDHLMKNNPHIIIVTNELGCGVVPILKDDRQWREKTGRVCTALASRCEKVYRVICGIGQRIR